MTALAGNPTLPLANSPLGRTIAETGTDIWNDSPRIDEPVDPRILDELRTRIPDFVRAYEPDGLAVGEFDGFGATARTLRAFIACYQELMTQVTDALVPNPDKRR